MHAFSVFGFSQSFILDCKFQVCRLIYFIKLLFNSWTKTDEPVSCCPLVVSEPMNAVIKLYCKLIIMSRGGHWPALVCVNKQWLLCPLALLFSSPQPSGQPYRKLLNIWMYVFGHFMQTLCRYWKILHIFLWQKIAFKGGATNSYAAEAPLAQSSQ